MKLWSIHAAGMMLGLALLLTTKSAHGEEAEVEPPRSELQSLLRARHQLARSGRPKYFNQGQLLPKDLAKIFETRLRSWTESYVRWLSQAGSLDQTEFQALRAAALEDADLEIRRTLQTPPQFKFTRPCDDFPALLQLDGGAAARIRDFLDIYLRHSALSAEKKRSLRAAADNQAVFQREALRDFTIAILDEHLYFTSAQRKILQNAFPLPKSQLSPWLFHVDSSVKFYREVPVDQLQAVSLGPEFSSNQSELLQAITGSEDFGTVTLQLPLSAEEWRLKMEEASPQQKRLAYQLAEVQLQYYQQEWQVPELAIFRMRLAAKGAVVFQVDDWKAKMLQENFSFSERFLRIGEGSAVVKGLDMSPERLASHEIWKSSLPLGFGELQRKDHQRREVQRRAALARVVVAMLDSELLLTPQQREGLIPHIAQTLPADFERLPAGIGPGVIWLAHAMLKLPAGVRRDILNPEQNSRWEELQQYFVHEPQWKVLQVPAVTGALISIMYDPK